MSLSDDNQADIQADIIVAFNSTSRYLDDLLNIDNPYFKDMVNQIYPPELQLNKANASDTEAPILDLQLIRGDLGHCDKQMIADQCQKIAPQIDARSCTYYMT